MQYLTITKDMTLWQLANIVGERNLDAVLNANGLTRSYNIGEQFYNKIDELKSRSEDVDYQKKINVLNQFVGDSDLYEKAALGSEDDWAALAAYNCFTDAIKIPEEVKLPSSVGILGNGEPIAPSIYQQCTDSLLNPNGEYAHQIDPTIFAEYNASYYGGASVGDAGMAPSSELFQCFVIPWGEVCLYSTLGDEMLYFPVYPEELSDGVSANYDEMPEMLYQYEPWNVYKSSGPREITFTFNFHRDMWTGDHRDGNANKLIRACQANCYPRYDGSLVNTALVTMFIHDQNFITGIMTDCKVNWEGPIGLDGFYLKCELSITIKEVSPQALDYTTVKDKRLIQ